MPLIDANGITINYRLEGDSKHELLVLINGLADDLTTWDAQVPAFLAAGYQVLRYDNRGIGLSSAPPGPYTANLLATDLHHLLHELRARRELSFGEFHLLGVSMGGMIAQSYALDYPNGGGGDARDHQTTGDDHETGLSMKSLSLCCTYAQPTAFCGRMFDLWADMAGRMSVQDVMRDVTLWAFTVPFFREREAELVEVEGLMRDLKMSTAAYLAQLNVIREFDTTSQLQRLRDEKSKLGGLHAGANVMVLAGEEDILIPVQLSRELAGLVEESQFKTVKGGHACLWEFPDDFNQTVIKFLDSLGKG